MRCVNQNPLYFYVLRRGTESLFPAAFGGNVISVPKQKEEEKKAIICNFVRVGF